MSQSASNRHRWRRVGVYEWRVGAAARADDELALGSWKRPRARLASRPKDRAIPIKLVVYPDEGHRIAKKEHQEFASNIDLIDVLPPGLYEATFEAKGADTANADRVQIFFRDFADARDAAYFERGEEIRLDSRHHGENPVRFGLIGGYLGHQF